MPPVKVQEKTFRHDTGNKVVFYSVASQNLNYFSLTLLKWLFCLRLDTLSVIENAWLFLEWKSHEGQARKNEVKIM